MAFEDADQSPRPQVVRDILSERTITPRPAGAQPCSSSPPLLAGSARQWSFRFCRDFSTRVSRRGRRAC
jgi:hypothetical protein